MRAATNCTGGRGAPGAAATSNKQLSDILVERHAAAAAATAAGHGVYHAVDVSVKAPFFER
jgi:hypothetical protein